MSDPVSSDSSEPFGRSSLLEFAQTAQHAARLGGEQLMSRLGKAKVEKKGPRDLVTEADFASQAAIKAFLNQEYPDHRFVGEEQTTDDLVSESREPSHSEFCWVVDPLDGTTNYVHRLPSFSVSVGLQYGGVSIAGAVWDPILKEMYWAAEGQGAYCNNEPIRASSCRKLSESMFVISLPRGVQRGDQPIEQMLNLLEAAGSIRRLGSAALNLCYVAQGRIDGYWATGLSAWDVAAGSLIAVEAGANLRGVDGAAFQVDLPSFICASTADLFEQARRILAPS